MHQAATTLPDIVLAFLKNGGALILFYLASCWYLFVWIMVGWGEASVLRPEFGLLSSSIPDGISNLLGMREYI